MTPLEDALVVADDAVGYPLDVLETRVELLENYPAIRRQLVDLVRISGAPLYPRRIPSLRVLRRPFVSLCPRASDALTDTRRTGQGVAGGSPRAA